MYQKNSPATIQKALYWLNKQDSEWSKHIQDSNTVVKMYLKSQTAEKPESSQFQKNLQQLLGERTGAVIKNYSHSKKPYTDSLTNTVASQTNLEPQKNLLNKPTPMESQSSFFNKLDMAIQNTVLAKPGSQMQKVENLTTSSTQEELLTEPVLDAQDSFFKKSDLSMQSGLHKSNSSLKVSPSQNDKQNLLVKKKKSAAFVLDDVSLNCLKELQKEFNLGCLEETLRLAIQAGRKSLLKI